MEISNMLTIVQTLVLMESKSVYRPNSYYFLTALVLWNCIFNSATSNPNFNEV